MSAEEIAKKLDARGYDIENDLRTAGVSRFASVSAERSGCGSS